MMYTECGQCGWYGPLSELEDHPYRPSPMDLGFCPECGTECSDVLTGDELAALIEDHK